MYKKTTGFIVSLIVLSILQLSFHCGADTKEGSENKVAPSLSEANGLMQRIDFGNSYIMGQTIQSGAVYLLQRKKSDIKSMLKARENYREELLEGWNISNGEMESNAKQQQ